MNNSSNTLSSVDHRRGRWRGSFFWIGKNA